MRTSLFLLLLLLSCCSISGRHPKRPADSVMAIADPQPVKDLTVYTDTVLHLEMFSDIPDSLKGCEWFYAADKKALNRKSFLFYSDLNNCCIFHLNGETIQLHLDRQEETPDGTRLEFSGEGWKVRLTQVITKDKWDIDESISYAGTLEIIHGTKRYSIDVAGNGGC